MGLSIEFDEQTWLLVTERAKVLLVDPTSLVQDIVRTQLARPESQSDCEEDVERSTKS